ncbi:branched-chain amino acid ABC transporter permease [Natronospirillum operosum]|uniref:Branched-chain amino acid ABC transporter permease n=2 Tax=Natronospirillum operosum TaxID=2759953 RepID=A0A4Z0WHL6_9GAMM|nr:branched-chain amino acid ABC transporter permease [Natronospirillum operosum]
MTAVDSVQTKLPFPSITPAPILPALSTRALWLIMRAMNQSTSLPVTAAAGRALMSGLRASLPLAIGYAPMAFSFGVVGIQAGLATWETLLISLIVFAGAAQFILVSMLAAGSGAGAALIAVWVLNLRHLFYGPALLSQLRERPGRLLPALAFGLTDEVFATAMAESTRTAVTPAWTLGVGIGAYSAWVGGTALGAWLGVGLGEGETVISHALTFVLPGLFIALLASALQRFLWPVVAVAATVTLILGWFYPSHVAMMAGMVAGALIRPALQDRSAEPQP